MGLSLAIGDLLGITIWLAAGIFSVRDTWVHSAECVE